MQRLVQAVPGLGCCAFRPEIEKEGVPRDSTLPRRAHDGEEGQEAAARKQRIELARIACEQKAAEQRKLKSGQWMGTERGQRSPGPLGRGRSRREKCTAARNGIQPLTLRCAGMCSLPIGPK